MTKYRKVSISDADFVDTVPDQEARDFEADYFVAAITSGRIFWAMQRLQMIKRFPESERPLLTCAFGGRIPYRSPFQLSLIL